MNKNTRKNTVHREKTLFIDAEKRSSDVEKRFFVAEKRSSGCGKTFFRMKKRFFG